MILLLLEMYFRLNKLVELILLKNRAARMRLWSLLKLVIIRELLGIKLSQKGIFKAKLQLVVQLHLFLKKYLISYWLRKKKQ